MADIGLLVLSSLFVNRILKSFPLDTPTENNINDLRSIEKKLEYYSALVLKT